MNLREIARIALDEAMEGQMPEGVEKTDNGDGTVTYSMTIGFDPKVQEEMAKAMPKGQKREDQADVIDEAPKGVFALALDEAIAEDAGNSRHANTPLENCRAKDPMFCPYHGQKAIQKWVTDEISKQFVNPNSMASVTVDVVQNGNDFTIKVTAPISFNSTAIDYPLQVLAQRKGIVVKKPSTGLIIGYGTHYSFAGKDHSTQLDFSRKPDYDKADMLKEWTDDLMIDVANDPQLQQEIDPKEFADYLGKLETVQSTANNLKNAATMGIPQQTAEQAYKSALDDAEKAYHMLRGQVEYKGVNNDTQLSNESISAMNDQKSDSGDYHREKSEVDSIKKIFWSNGKFPNGFAKANPFVASYNEASQSVGYFADKKFNDAKQEYDSWMLRIQNNGYKPTPADIQQLKGIASSVKYGAKNYSEALTKYKDAKQTFMQDLYDWAMHNQGKPYCPNQNDINKAFPNGRPQ